MKQNMVLSFGDDGLPCFSASSVEEEAKRNGIKFVPSVFFHVSILSMHSYIKYSV